MPFPAVGLGLNESVAHGNADEAVVEPIRYLFDVLYLERSDVTRLPLARRQELLGEAVDWSDRIRRTASVPGRGIEAWKRACEASEEGIVGKRLDSLYVPGRSDAWVKIKCVGRQEFVIAGWTDPQRSRVGLGRPARRLLRGRAGSATRARSARDTRARYCSTCANGSTRWARRPIPSTTASRRSARPSTGSSRSSWPRSPSPSGPRTGCSASRGTRGSVPTRRPSSAAASGPPRLRPSGKDCSHLPGDTAMPLEEYNSQARLHQDPRAVRGRRRRRRTSSRSSSCRSTTPRSMHYDFRLEADGVLKSWSVPKGPSMDPSVKRLAVQVEDHPIGYATFEGTIPQGQYGGGTVEIWDHGTYESLMDRKAEPQTAAEAIDAGRIEFVMHGERLKGKFALIRMKPRGKGKPQWLLMKLKDEFAEAGSDEDPEARGETQGRRQGRPPRPARAGNGKAPKTVELTHPDRVIYPDAGLTKEDVFAYYEKVADRLLPFLKDRPITLERLPEGLAERLPHFWQKDTPDYYPDWIPRIELETERGKAVHYALVNDERDAALPREPGDADLPRLGVAGRRTSTGPTSCSSTSTRARRRSRRRRRGQGHQGDAGRARASSRS